MNNEKALKEKRQEKTKLEKKLNIVQRVFSLKTLIYRKKKHYKHFAFAIHLLVTGIAMFFINIPGIIAYAIISVIIQYIIRKKKYPTSLIKECNALELELPEEYRNKDATQLFTIRLTLRDAIIELQNEIEKLIEEHPELQDKENSTLEWHHEIPQPQHIEPIKLNVGNASMEFQKNTLSEERPEFDINQKLMKDLNKED